MNDDIAITLLCVTLSIFICVPIFFICKCTTICDKKYEIIREI